MPLPLGAGGILDVGGEGAAGNDGEVPTITSRGDPGTDDLPAQGGHPEGQTAGDGLAASDEKARHERRRSQRRVKFRFEDIVNRTLSVRLTKRRHTAGHPSHIQAGHGRSLSRCPSALRRACAKLVRLR